MTDSNLMIHIMKSPPEQYDHIVDNLETRLMKKDDDPYKLTLDDLQEKLSDRYARIIDMEEHESEKDKGLDGNFQQQFKGLFRYCGKYAHRAAVCKSRLLDLAKGSIQGQRYQNSSTAKRPIERETHRFMGKLIVGRLDIKNGSLKMR